MTYPVQGQEVVPASPARGAGQVNPYRGLDVHGVPSAAVWQDVPAPEVDTVKVPVYEEPEVQEPVPVRIVSEGGRERRLFRTYSDSVKPLADVPARMIVPLNEHRTKVTVYNTDTGGNGILLASSPDALPLAGIPVASTATGNAKEEFTSETPVYACTANGAPGTVVRVVIKEEYAVQE